MRTQQRFFSQPFRKAYRHRPSPRLSAQRSKKRRISRRGVDLQMDPDRFGWSPDELQRFWQNTSG